MSYCELTTFNNGVPDESIEYRNSWGGAAFVWDNLYEKYLKNPEKPYDNWLTGNAKGLWDLAKNPDLPLYMRAVHVSMFDRAIVLQKDFAQFAKHLREFVSYFGTGDRVCHLLEWANFVENCTAEAIGFYPTSVSENLWYEYRYDEDKDESVIIPYNLNEMDLHLNVYDYLREVDNAQT